MPENYNICAVSAMLLGIDQNSKKIITTISFQRKLEIKKNTFLI